MTLQIRPMLQSDIDTVHIIESSAHHTPWSHDILRDCVLVGYDCRVLELIEEHNKKIVGYIICRYSVKSCHILNLCVACSEQGKGYGKFLLQAVFDSFQQSDINTVILEVRPSNKVAIALYKKFGFQKDSIKEGYYKDEKGEEDAILLKKTF
ncbi:ribosomal protein S18-alanine N-acetyltransferase [Legionella fairfieldensis]|uniref:ribosomal protein S18-alanine N-acetyltransferase n=1 Tax=Legionella fairfieldensis TaxID=45064 RepID=UPI00048B386F|nr:ribosomal protein S18-alanine N-acetyltransferase [Legionella fairfieldensis]